jgi:hypothetical protein
MEAKQNYCITQQLCESRDLKRRLYPIITAALFTAQSENNPDVHQWTNGLIHSASPHDGILCSLIKSEVCIYAAMRTNLEHKLTKEARHKGHMSYDFIYMRYSE